MFDEDSGSAVRALVMHFTRQRSELLAWALFDGEQSASPTGESERAPGNVGKTPQNQQFVLLVLTVPPVAGKECSSIFRAFLVCKLLSEM